MAVSGNGLARLGEIEHQALQPLTRDSRCIRVGKQFCAIDGAADQILIQCRLVLDVDFVLALLDLCAELEVKIVPMFWGVAFGWELATGYPWGFWKGGDYDLVQEGSERFVKKTAKIRARAKSLGIYLAHEIHPGTAAMCADDFNLLVDICDGDKTLAVNADPSHCWEGEDWETRFRKVASRVYACHVKNFVIRSGIPLRKMAPEWADRAMQFTDLPSGDLNMARYVEMLVNIGYPTRYCQVMGTKTAPLIAEA